MNNLWATLQIGSISGAVGAVGNSLAIEATKALGLKPGTGGLARLVFGHPLTRLQGEIFHFGMGVSMGVAYVLVVRDRLWGPGWLRGLLFAQVPGVMQLFWVLPSMGHGPGGIRISPLTPVLAWSLNALFGVIIGVIAGVPPPGARSTKP